MSKNVVVGIVEEWGCELLEDKTRFLKRLILKWFQKPSLKVASAMYRFKGKKSTIPTNGWIPGLVCLPP